MSSITCSPATQTGSHGDLSIILSRHTTYYQVWNRFCIHLKKAGIKLSEKDVWNQSFKNKFIILNFHKLRIVFSNVAKIFKKVPRMCYTFQTIFLQIFFKLKLYIDIIRNRVGCKLRVNKYHSVNTIIYSLLPPKK